MLLLQKISAQPFKQPLTAPVPQFRIAPGNASQTTGVDFAGPFYCKEGKKEKNTYTALFMCATSRALHIEPVEDQTAKPSGKV